MASLFRFRCVRATRFLGVFSGVKESRFLGGLSGIYPGLRVCGCFDLGVPLGTNYVPLLGLAGSVEYPSSLM